MKIWLQMVIFAFLSPGMIHSASLRILTENLPPLNYVKDGALIGPSVEMVKEIQKRIGSTEEIQVYPWARAYQIALNEENVVLFGVSHTPPREDKFKWVGPLATKRDIFVAKRGSNQTPIMTFREGCNLQPAAVIRMDSGSEGLRRTV